MSLNRREFVILTAAGACALAAGELAAAEAPQTVSAGRREDYSRDGVYDKLAKSNKLLLIRKDDRLYATTAVCTHRACILKPVSGELRCPCHGSRYSLAGQVARGPATDSLVRYGISCGGDGAITVDLNKKFEPAHWEDDGSYLKMP
jgi:Rieske Fe-S protein